MTPIVEARRLTVGREGKPVVAAIDLAIARRERVALLGANGSGKTTLLRALAGLDAPLAGELRWLGGPLPRGPARAERLGVLFQDEPASPFTVEELVTLGLALDGPPPPWARRRVAELLAVAALSTLRDRSLPRISGGEAQRARLARALVCHPGLLLLDEPTNHLDPARQAALLAFLDDARESTAIVLATHDLGLASMCDRVALIGGGRLQALGSPAAVLTPWNLTRTLGVLVRRVDDPDGGPPLLRVVAEART